MSASARPGQGTDVYRYLVNEGDYPDLPAEAAVEHLSRALQCRTVSSVDVSQIDYGELDRLHELIRASYPHVMAAGTYEEVDHSLLITIPGTDPSLRPIQLMAHQDVVPVVPGTEADWTHDAFSGHVDDEFIWGRGAMDIKEMLIGELEAVDYLLARLEREDRQLKRTLILAFGEDEECLQQGSRAIAKVLEGRGVRLEFLVDEGDYAIADGTAFGAPACRSRWSSSARRATVTCASPCAAPEVTRPTRSAARRLRRWPAPSRASSTTPTSCACPRSCRPRSPHWPLTSRRSRSRAS